jgi:hypothetical protein
MRPQLRFSIVCHGHRCVFPSSLSLLKVWAASHEERHIIRAFQRRGVLPVAFDPARSDTTQKVRAMIAFILVVQWFARARQLLPTPSAGVLA